MAGDILATIIISAYVLAIFWVAYK